MRFVIQRVSESEVKVDGESLGKIGNIGYPAGHHSRIQKRPIPL